MDSKELCPAFVRRHVESVAGSDPDSKGSGVVKDASRDVVSKGTGCPDPNAHPFICSFIQAQLAKTCQSQ